MSSLVGKIPQSWRHSSSSEQSIVPDLSLSRFLNSRSKSLKKGKYNGYLYSSFESVGFEIQNLPACPESHSCKDV